jgi:hypothetical protein
MFKTADSSKKLMDKNFRFLRLPIKLFMLSIGIIILFMVLQHNAFLPLIMGLFTCSIFVGLRCLTITSLISSRMKKEIILYTFGALLLNGICSLWIVSNFLMRYLLVRRNNIQ